MRYDRYLANGFLLLFVLKCTSATSSSSTVWYSQKNLSLFLFLACCKVDVEQHGMLSFLPATILDGLIFSTTLILGYNAVKLTHFSFTLFVSLRMMSWELKARIPVLLNSLIATVVVNESKHSAKSLLIERVLILGYLWIASYSSF